MKAIRPANIDDISEELTEKIESLLPLNFEKANHDLDPIYLISENNE